MGRRASKLDRNMHDPSKSIRKGSACANKKRYATEEEAEFEAEIRYIRYYYCKYCRGYHLTSKDR
jgi:hypothetical protein